MPVFFTFIAVAAVDRVFVASAAAGLLLLLNYIENVCMNEWFQAFL